MLPESAVLVVEWICLIILFLCCMGLLGIAAWLAWDLWRH